MAVVCGILGVNVSITACSEEPEVDPTAVAPTVAVTEPVATTPETTTPETTSPAPDTTTPDSATPAAASTTAVVDAARPLVTFTDVVSVDGWSNIDDTVMGGVSASTTSWESGRLVFAGDLSLENNGGFASIRGPADPALGAAIGDATALVVDAEGDGRTYVLQLRTADESLYITRFTTTAGEAEQFALPLAAFEPVTRFLEPSPGSPSLDARTVVQLAVFVLDAQEGSFRLAIGGIAAQ
jgi:NADH dehydrogenase [ubiquinone] 1 alpha subcomplex assembly factor 1